MSPIRKIIYPGKNRISNRLKINIINLQNRIPVSKISIKKTVRKVLSTEAPKESGLVNVIIVKDNLIKKINKRHLSHDFPTDVISFDLSDPGKAGFCADIIASADTANRNSVFFKTSPNYELHLYIVHGILHILGYDDKTMKQRMLMNGLAQELLGKLNIK